MKQINNAELGLKTHNVYMDFLKSDYLLNAQNLMWAIFDSDDIMSLESKKEISDMTEFLVNSKDELIDSLEEFIQLVDITSHEVEHYLKEMIK